MAGLPMSDSSVRVRVPIQPSVREGGGRAAAAGKWGPAHRFPVRVYYEDTDSGGIVYYANYLKFAERARTEMLRDLGVNHADMVERSGVGFSVRYCEVEYLRPARLDDLLEVVTRVTGVGGAVLELEQIVLRAGDEAARLHIKLACLNRSGRPVRLPDGIRAALESRRQQEEKTE
jgi:acyl-CoA thioester hydrolase